MPRGLRKIKISFDATGITRFGGLLIFQQFCKSLGLRRFLQRRIRWPAYVERKFHPADLFLAHLFAIVAGLGRIENTQSLKLNGLFPHLLGLPDFPHKDTLRSFLWRFTPTDLQSLKSAHNELREELLQRIGICWNAVVDMDATHLTVYGNQEGATVGYNQAKRGKRSYSPLLSSEGRSGISLNMELRSGHEHSSTGVLPFLKDSLSLFPSTLPSSRLRLRADAGFYDKDIVHLLDERGHGYVITARVTSPIQHRLTSLRFRPFKQHWATAEFSYQPIGWNRPHRFISVRRFLGESDRSSTLFRIKDFDYRVLVSNLDIDPPGVWRFYRDRGSQELLIRELKNAYALAKIPTRSFHANAAYLEITTWAYDLVVGFKALCLPPAYQHWNTSTLRREFWSLPAQWVHTGHQNILRLPPGFSHQKTFRRVELTLLKIKPLI
jgi:hypothetical protein